MYIKFEGQTHKVEEWNGSCDEIILEDGREYVLFNNRQVAGDKAKEYWEDMSQNDKSEFVCLVGEDTILAWALGDWGGPGTTKVRCIEDWLDLWTDLPEEHFARYDGEEVEVDRISPCLGDAIGEYDNYSLGFELVSNTLTNAPCHYVMYRTN